MNDWPLSVYGCPEISPFARRRDELSAQNGCILWGSRMVAPPSLCRLIVEELHCTHAESSQMKELARSCVWWPGMDCELEEVSNLCTDCLKYRSSPHKALLHPWEWPSRPWHRVEVGEGIVNLGGRDVI